MRTVPDWLIQTTWWISGIFATGAVWYFLSAGRYVLTGISAAMAILFAIIAIVMHRRKDAADHFTHTSVATSTAEVSSQSFPSQARDEKPQLICQYVGNVNSITRNGPAIKAALVDSLPNTFYIQVIPAATINIGTGIDAIQKFQYQITFVSNRLVTKEEFASVISHLIVDLNSFHTQSDA